MRIPDFYPLNRSCQTIMDLGLCQTQTIPPKPRLDPSPISLWKLMVMLSNSSGIFPKNSLIAFAEVRIKVRVMFQFRVGITVRISQI